MDGDDRALFTRQLNRSQLIALDAGVAAVYTLVVVAIAFAQTSALDPALAGPPLARLIMVLAMGVPLAVRRLWPVPIFGIVLAASILAHLLGVVRDGFVGAAFALYIVALNERRSSREPTLLIAALSLIGVTALVATGSPAPIDATVTSIALGAVMLGGAWTIGRAIRERRRFAVRSAAQQVERAVTEERLRIARDLHDVIAHGLSLIVVKAATANHVASARPEEAREALEVIETTGRAALAEMREMLDVLRSDELGFDGDLTPSPSLDRLPALADRVAMAGVQVDFDLDGLPELPESLNLSIYRIVQEALTNVVKHAAPARCHVSISAADGEARVEIVDDGLRAGLAEARSDGNDATGHGLIGLRERVRLLGGEFVAGPKANRGFRVFARIPYGGQIEAAAERA